MKRFDVICIGEVLIDLISQEPGKRLADVSLFKKFAGGAPANVAVGLAKLGCQVAFAGKVGNDSFGRFLRKYLDDHDINTEALIGDPQHNTRLAFVEIAGNGERAFEFSEKHPADSALKVDDFTIDLLKNSKIVHFGSLPLTIPANWKLFDKLISQLNQQNVLTSFDPNYRPTLWKSARSARKALGNLAARSQILKVSLEEGVFLTGIDDLEGLPAALFGPDTRLLSITMGERGCILKNRNITVKIPGFSVKVADMTGCGDAFTAGLLAKLIQSGKSPDDLNESELITFGQYANAMAALTATRLGATDALPRKIELEKFLKTLKLT
ncbi:MAG: carbohydrate kinase [Candidatus Marinimicrobia bacterium]|nr:carbohydrate kinase [Candidatus Neomarinimicrobiota bacterium]